jgi:hypothetical protein
MELKNKKSYLSYHPETFTTAPLVSLTGDRKGLLLAFSVIPNDVCAAGTIMFPSLLLCGVT